MRRVTSQEAMVGFALVYILSAFLLLLFVSAESIWTMERALTEMHQRLQSKE